MDTKKYISLDKLKTFLSNLSGVFAPLKHKHTLSDISDYKVDAQLSSTSANPVQNKVLNAEFDAISTAFDVIEAAIDNKADEAHSHAISDITNLQSTLNGKASTSHGTHVTFSSTAPVMDGTASVGSATTVARSDHKHPSDSTKASQTSLDSHTSNTTSHITSTERNNWNTAYTHSQSAHAPSNSEPNQNAFSNVQVGNTVIAADIKTDTLTLVAGNNITITPDATNDKITIAAKDTTYSLGSFGITATATELNKLDGVTATTSEINYLDGVTSGVQAQLDGKAAKSHKHIVSDISDLTATATELNYMDGVTSNVQTQLDTLTTSLGTKAKKISFNGQCQVTSYRTSVIALCKAPTNTSCGGAINSYSAGQLTLHRNNGLYAPVIAIVSMGASHGATNRVRVRSLCSSGFSIFNPCTFTYNGVTYGGIEFKTSDAEAQSVTFVGETTLDMFALDIYDSNKKAILNEEVYNSISYDNAIIETGWKDTNNSVITSFNIGSQSVSSATKDGSGNIITSTYETKTDASNKLTTAKTYADSAATTAANKVKNDLLNGAGAAYDTLKELGDLIDDNQDAIDALEIVAASKANATDLTSHTSNKSNPHGITLAQLGITATAAEINKIDGVTATTAELNILDGVTATTAEINYLDGVTSGIQAQLDGKSSSSHTHKYAGSSSVGGAATSANKLNTNAGSATQPVYFANGIPVATTYTLGKSVPSNAVFTDTNTHYTSKNVVGTTNALTNTTSALSNGAVYLNSVENGVVTSSHKISGSGATTVTTDTNGNIVITSIDNNTTYSAAGSSLGLVKSGGDVTISSGVITVNDDSHNHTIANVDNLQASLDGKQATVTGGASTITGSNLTASRALISNSSGKVAVSAVTSTELGYLDGVTSNIQTQLDGKSGTSHTHNTTYIPDTRSDNQTPAWYIANYPRQVITEFKNVSTIGLSGETYCELTTYVQWSNNSGGYPSQETIIKGRLYTRYGTSDTAWSDWKTNIDSDNISSQSVATAASCTGNSATATKLQTARTIALGTGATGTATSFNGTGNITIPVTDIKESYLSWGGKNLSGSISPIGASLSSEHSANRIAYLNPNAIKVEYSNDAGSTWTDSGLANSAKINLVTTSNGVSVGSNSTVTTNHRTRITLTGQDGTNGYVYTRPRKMLINVSTAGHGMTVTIEAKTGASGASWTTLGTYQLSGWSGWNDIPISISTFGGGANQTGNYWYMRLTFATTSVSSSYTTTKSTVLGLRLFGDTCWTRTSNMGETGHLYSYDSSQNATFPANVTAATLSGTTFSGGGVATLAEVKSYLGI